MKDVTVLGRSFSKQDQRALGFGAFLGFLIIALTTFTLFKTNFKPLPNFAANLNFSLDDSSLKMLVAEEGNTTTTTTSESGPRLHQTQLIEAICNFSGPISDFCNMSGDIRIHGSSSTVFVYITDHTTSMLPGNSSYTIKPYALRGDNHSLWNVQEFTVKIASSHSEESEQLIPQCTRNHSAAGIVFSISGYAENMFHTFSDVIIPLYLTSREFNGEVEFLVTNKQSWWLKKYEAILKKLSKYDVIDIDTEKGVHCFPKMVVGLKRHKIFGIDPSMSPKLSMADFRKFLREVYSLKDRDAIQLRDGRPPRLLIISRKKIRTFTNEGEIVESARKLGFEVIATEGESDLARFSRLVHSCDVMMGVHGAGLTNMLFLPEKAVLIQIIPFGGLEWFCRYYFGYPIAKDMNLRYLDYMISLEESSLVQEYLPDHPVLRDPPSVYKKGGWLALSNVYLRKQNVTLDVARFNATLLEAKKLLLL